MGSKYEIQVYKQTDYDNRYEYVEYWRGERLKDALKVLAELKKSGAKCYRLTCRP